MLFPQHLRPGDPIFVVAPSGPFDEDALTRGLGRLAEFEIRVPETLLGRQIGFFAGDDETRRAELQAALNSSSAKALLIARGGYGLGRIVGQLSWEGFRQSPKWIIGFSDATTLHLALQARGIASLHAPNGTTLATARDSDFRELQSVLLGKKAQNLTGLLELSPGTARGPLAGGNLTVLFTEAVSGRLLLPPGAILFLEDVTETSYRIDRMLDALLQGGHLKEISGVVLGDFHDCSAGKFGVPTEDVLRAWVARLGVPCASGLPTGHGSQNHPLLLGAHATLDTKKGSLSLESEP